jgi:SAM-dependent methyltransferase
MNAFQRLNKSLETRGLLSTVLLAGKKFGVLWSKFGDQWFDIRHGTDTSGIIEVEDLDVTSPNRHYAMRYEVTRARALTRLLRKLDLPQSGVFVDIGCGKGRVLMIAAEYGFSRVVGLEYSHDLCETARRNLSAFQRSIKRTLNVQIVETDVVDYEIRPDENVFFMFNPFDSEILELILGKVEQSVAAHPRDVWLIYLYPEFRRTIDASDAFEETGRHVWGDCEFVVYENRGNGGRR